MRLGSASPMRMLSRPGAALGVLSLLTAGLAFTPTARANDAGAPPAAPTPSSAATAAPASAPTSESPPAIATPAPGASPSGVSKAQAIAKVAEKTPIVPNPGDATRPAFQLYAEMDLPVVGIGLVFAAARLVKTQPAFCAPLCNPSDLNPIDRITAGYYNPGWATASDVGVYGVMVGTAALLLAEEGVLDTVNDAVVIAESGLSATAVASIMTLAAGRPRPELFGTDAPLDVRQSSDAALSFLSSHSAVTSAVVTSTFMAMRRLHPKSALPYVVLSVGGAVSAFVATARVLAGKHFLSDVVGGLVVGTSLGVLIPALHDSPVKVVPVVSETQRGFSVLGAF